jgi:hypothetical protein
MELGKNIDIKIRVSAADSVSRSVFDSIFESLGLSLWNLVGPFNNSKYGIR